MNSSGGDGAEVIYALRNSDTLSRTIANEFIKSGQNVRKYYQRRLISDPSKDYYYMLRNTPNNESIIVEYGFADSSSDDVSQIKNNWQELTEAVVRALANYIGVPYTPPVGMESNYYIVKPGDTLYSIARTYGVSVEEIKDLNHLLNNNLTIGMTLLLPTNNNSKDDIYIVKPGDTLYSIANLYKMSVNELKVLNNLSNNVLSVGQKLLIKPSVNGSDNTYIVKSGDSLYSIAKKYGITVDALKNANNKVSNMLTIGEVLIIPDGSSNSNYYIVKPGDTLYGIAKQFNITVDKLRNLNNLVNNTLSIGQQLIIS